MDDMAELREHAAAQAALFNISDEDSESSDEPTPAAGMSE
jgi:hypothetical protein